MDRIPVVSSNLKSVGYNSQTETLEVEFKDNKLYEYLNVPSSLHTGLMNAESKGGFLDKYIKKAGYKYNQLR